MNSGTLTANGAITGTGTINGNSGNIRANYTVATGLTFNPGTSTVTIGGTFTGLVTGFGSYYNLAVSNTNGYTLNKNIIVYGNITGAGKIIAGNYTMQLNGNMSITTFTYGTSTVKLTGTNKQTINASYTFYNLENDNDSGSVMYGDVTINNNLKFDPISGPGAYTGAAPLYLNGHYFTMGSSATITGAGTTNGFIVPGTGNLSMYAGTTNVIFPIGTSDSVYSPVSIHADASTSFMVGLANSMTNQELNTVIKHGLNATWKIIPAADVTGFSSTMQWTSDQELPVFDRNNLYIYYRNDESAPTAWTRLGSLTSASGSNPYTITTSSMAMSNGSNYYFAVGDNNLALPVELISLTARPENGKNILEWRTASEINNDHFEIQRSEDAKNWNKIGETAGHGTTQEEETYSFIDASASTLAANTVYYRLRQVDYNGTSEYSGIRKVSVANSNAGLKLYPNPAKDILNISFGNYKEAGTIKIFNMNGACVYNYESVTLEEQIDLKYFKSGIYVLKVFTTNDVNTQVFYKE